MLEWPAGQGELVLLRVVRGLPLPALPRVQELHLRHEAYRLQAGRAALWLQLDDHAALPELLAADVQAQKVRARTVVLLAEALGLLREETDPVSAEPGAAARPAGRGRLRTGPCLLDVARRRRSSRRASGCCTTCMTRWR